MWVYRAEHAVKCSGALSGTMSTKQKRHLQGQEA